MFRDSNRISSTLGSVASARNFSDQYCAQGSTLHFVWGQRSNFYSTAAHLSLHYAGLRETIPTTLGNWKLLESLSLRVFQNSLTGTLPTELGSWTV